MTALATAADLAKRLGVSTPAFNTPQRLQWDELLDDATAIVEDAIGCTIARTTSTVRLPLRRTSPSASRDWRPPTADRFAASWALGAQLVALPAVPAVSVAAVTDDDGPVDFELVDAATLRVWSPAAASAATTLTVTYEHGWAETPAELRRWTLVLAASMLQAAGTGNLGMAGGISSVRVDDGQVSFAASAPGEAVDLPERIRARLRATYGPPALEVTER